MRANRARDTGPEMALRRAATAAGLRGYRLHVKGLPGKPDLAFTRYKVAVFVHGCFWHRCPVCNPPAPKRHAAFWRRKFAENQERDARKSAALELRGWAVIEVWECELRANKARCVTRLSRAIAAAGDE
ncbi:MAG: very short patch repair endonuclease [Candidatus Eisenbacteria bacterium]